MLSQDSILFIVYGRILSGDGTARSDSDRRFRYEITGNCGI